MKQDIDKDSHQYASGCNTGHRTSPFHEPLLLIARELEHT